jgi:uncharacterized protein (TIGR02594 family)
MKFENWLQSRLIAHGAQISSDGDWGRSSIIALQAFQKAQGLPETGVAGTATIEALRQEPTKSTFAAPVPLWSEPRMPPWMAEMHRKMGLNEVKDNAALSSWLRSFGRFLGDPKNLPWCGDAVESCIAKTLPSEPLPSNPFFAQAWAKFGKDVHGPVVGAIGVIKWSATSGHVGIVAGVTGDRVNLLGGNQSNSINITSFPISKFMAFRWPLTFPFQHYVALKGSAGSGNLDSTR